MKELLIDNKNELYKKMKLYKNFLYRWTTIKTSIEDEECQNIIKALNIRKRSKRLEFIYDYCCNKLDIFYSGKNVCGFSNNKCIVQQAPNCKYKNGCCRLCVYQSETGCKTANLTCKLFYCSSVTSKYKVITFQDLKILKLLSLRQRLILRDSFFSTREQILTDLYFGSIVIFAFRMAIRETINLIKLGIIKKHKIKK